uniref:Ubiquitin carboxyl-terminal hydrolase MINDY n=1 Tax=Pogona vitticeps TaxID=103695 RepID=A0A6J0UVS2_9SAUR|nr:ubiquitin carboxyl-terminal hydrolase FAM188A [Pogona vitticeps]XP_020662309.1 ubiquitin carboxyl-terminal hydrolase FAM188A [Pogona vitticeps]XP_020662310.1 ubiquitin carboxyl-terminal hydrolase FAM188A [Pogona vitticeps]XP_020662311.1 ubiquitin carboxyl-terminal hydrolase FAM188A [Pogona vitticeps]
MAELGQEVVHLVWGKKPGSQGLGDTIFCRWAQGFVFSESESTALEQFEGGPCAVIAPVQAFLLKKLFSWEKSAWRQCQEEEQKNLLCHTLTEILEMACSDHSESYCLATWQKRKTAEESASISESPAESSHQEEQPSALAVEELGFERFHALIHKQSFTSFPDFKEAVWNHFSVWTNKFGVLLFLYSVILTKGIENIKNEIEDSTEPLIDPVYGHGSQSLINLLLTGHAVSNVWDGDRECSGMKLLGIHKQATVGFLTLMESLRYCKVGSYLKSPKFPIWILGSETHLTVFFAKDLALVAPEAPSEQARRVFQTYDPEDNGFIPDTLLEDVMKALDLVSDPEYVNLMKTKLDPEGLGIILLGPFLQEFFPEQDSKVQESFTVYHYNGLKQSNYNEKVMYVEGTAVIMGFEDPMLQTDDTPIKRCLQTKWPYVELLWTTDRSPSLN